MMGLTKRVNYKAQNLSKKIKEMIKSLFIAWAFVIQRLLSDFMSWHYQKYKIQKYSTENKAYP